MAYEEDILKPWGKFLVDIAKTVENEELKDIKLVLGDKLTKREREGINDPVDLLECLEDKGLIGEDNTGLLRELFHNAQHYLLIKDLDRYEVRRKDYLERVSMLAGRRDPLFVGRDWYIREILDFFKESRHPGVRCVCLWGMAGSGKTKLGAETCAIYAEMVDNPKPRLILVDLNKKDSIAEVGITFLSSVGQPVEVNKFDFQLVFNWIRTCSTEHVFLFDNADDLLKPMSSPKDNFQNMLKQTLEWHNPNIKIIITSRYAVNFQHLIKNQQNFKEIEVKSLEMEEAVELLLKSTRQGHQGHLQVKGRELITEDQAMKLSEHCGNNPQALRAVASQLRSGKKPENVLSLLSNPMKMDMVLNDQSLWGLGQDATIESARESRQVLQCLGAMFEDMDESLKPHLIRLAVLPGLFSQTWALHILSDVMDHRGSTSDQEELESTLLFQLDDVAATSLLLRESLDIFQTGSQEDERFYSMHPLVRCLCLMRVEKDDNLKEAFRAGLMSFINESFQMLKNFTANDQLDASGSLQRLEKERSNIMHYLELEMRRTFNGKTHPLAKYLPEYDAVLRRSNMGRESDILAFMERFMFTKQRRKFFELRAKVAYESGDMPGWVNHQGWYADQQLQLHVFNEAEDAITNPLAFCRTQARMTSDLMEGYSQCLYVKGNLLVYKPQPRGHAQNKTREEGTQILRECVRLRDKNLGNSIVGARSINALGSACFQGRNYEDALTHHRKALEVLRIVTHNRPESHPDYTFYLMNIGTCYHELGYRYSLGFAQKEKSKEYYQKAIRTYTEGQEALRGVGLEKSSTMGTMLKNLAMTYCEMKDFRRALEYADRAAGIRVRTLGEDHPDVARALYFVGSLYMSIGDEERKSGKNIYEIDEYKKARECFDKALDIEFKNGYDRRSQDYGDLKEDIETLFKTLKKPREWQRYNSKFKKHEQGELVHLGTVKAEPSTSSSSSGSSSSSSSLSGQASTSLEPYERKRRGDSIEPTSSDAPDSPPDPKKCYVS